jgi:dolichol-phosphate mannosyltransferase
MRVLICIPTYNEIENIKPLIDSIMSVVPSNVEVLVIDDGSPDGTGQLVDTIGKQNPRVHALHRPKKMGLGTAYVNGFKWGLEKGFDALIEMDADFSHDPKYLPKMLELLEKNDVVIGSRYVSGGGTLNWGLGRKFISRGGSFYSRMILSAPIRDFTGGFNGWRRKVVESVAIDTLRSDGYSFQIELKYRAFVRNFRITEFPIIFEDRKVGKSKMNKKIVFEALGRVWGFRWRAVQQGHGILGRLLSGGSKS